MSQFDLPDLFYYVTLHVSGLTPIIRSYKRNYSLFFTQFVGMGMSSFICMWGFYSLSIVSSACYSVDLLTVVFPDVFYPWWYLCFPYGLGCVLVVVHCCFVVYPVWIVMHYVSVSNGLQ
jgi:hypothetical protein